MALNEARIPSLDSLRALEALAEFRNIDRAAEALHISPSALSKRLSALEEFIGAGLLDRSSRQIRLTPQGADYLAQIRPALDLLRAVPLHQPLNRRTRRLRVMTPPTFARQVLVPQLEAFTQAHADVELELILSLPQGSKADPGSCDVEIRFCAPLPGQAPLLADQVIPMAAASFIGKLPLGRSPADVLSMPRLRTPLEPWSPWLKQAGLPTTEPAEGPRFFDLGMLMEAAIAGLGVALCRPALAHQWLQSGILVPVTTLAASPAYLYHALIHSDHPQASAFDSWLTHRCQALQEQSQRCLQEKFSALR